MMTAQIEDRSDRESFAGFLGGGRALAECDRDQRPDDDQEHLEPERKRDQFTHGLANAPSGPLLRERQP